MFTTLQELSTLHSMCSLSSRRGNPINQKLSCVLKVPQYRSIEGADMAQKKVIFYNEGRQGWSLGGKEIRS